MKKMALIALKNKRRESWPLEIHIEKEREKEIFVFRGRNSFNYE